MGTMGEWAHVAFAAVFWGTWMLIWSRRKTDRADVRRSLFLLDALTWCFAGLVWDHGRV